MIPLTPRFLIAAANSFDGLRDRGGSNLGLIIARLLTPVADEAVQSDAAFVFHAGYAAHFDPEMNGSTWPLPAVASCQRLADFARRHRVLEDEPEEGDVFLLYDMSKLRFVRTGIVARLKEAGETPAGRPWFDCHTVEWVGNTDGTQLSPAVIRTLRRFYPHLGDRFIRWPNLDMRMRAADALTAA